MHYKTQIKVRIVQLEISGRIAVLLSLPARKEINFPLSQLAESSRPVSAKKSAANLLSLDEPWVLMLAHEFDSSLRAYLLFVSKLDLTNTAIKTYMFLGLPDRKPQPVQKSAILTLTAVYYVQPWASSSNSAGQLAASAQSPTLDDDSDEDSALLPPDSSLGSAPAHSGINHMVVFDGPFDELLAPKGDSDYLPVTCQFVISRRTPRKK